MVLSYEETEVIEAIKQENKLILLREQDKYAENEHLREMQRLNKQLEIALVGKNE